MSVPKKRNPPHVTNTPRVQKGLIYHKVIPVVIVIFMLFGVGFGYLIIGYDTVWFIGGALIGGACGLLFGLLLAKGLSKK